MTGLTWRGWLQAQTDRGDATGDLARFAFGGACQPSCRFTSYERFVQHLVLGHDADAFAAAARSAQKQYRAFARTRQLGAVPVARHGAIRSPVGSDGPAGDTQPPSDRSTRDR